MLFFDKQMLMPIFDKPPTFDFDIKKAARFGQLKVGAIANVGGYNIGNLICFVFYRQSTIGNLIGNLVFKFRPEPMR